LYLVISILLLGSLTACVGPEPLRPAPVAAPPCPAVVPVCEGQPDRELFVAGVEAILRDGDAGLLSALERDHPGSALVPLARQVRAALLAQSEAAARAQRYEAERSACLSERDRLDAENATLRHGLDELKRLTIEMETRSK
jgi:hypothetical protein